VFSNVSKNSTGPLNPSQNEPLRWTKCTNLLTRHSIRIDVKVAAYRRDLADYSYLTVPVDLPYHESWSNNALGLGGTSMHIFGKILLFMIVLAAPFAIYLAARSIHVRNSWAQQVESLEKSNQNVAESLEEKRKQLTELRTDLNREMLGWDLYWTDVQTNPNNGAVTASGLGTNQGLIQRDGTDAPRIFGFQPAGDGAYRFVGSFEAATLAEDRAALAPTWTPRPTEEDRWQAQQPGDDLWRWRAVVPDPYPSGFSDLQKALTIADDIWEDKNRELDLQTRQVAAATQQLNYRLVELLGQPDNEESLGLQEENGRAEQYRDAALEEVDRLRRELSRELAVEKRLTDENRQFVEK